MSKDQQALLAVRTLDIKKTICKGKKRAAKMAELTEEFGCGVNYPAKVLKDLIDKEKLPASRAHVGQRNYRITEEKGLELTDLLRTNGFDMTYRQIQDESGIPKSTLQRWMKRNNWRQVG